METLDFGSSTAASTVTFQNGINLNGANRTVNVDDNAASTADNAADSRASSRTQPVRPASSRPVQACCNYPAANTFNGGVTINGGTLQVATFNNGNTNGPLGNSSSAAANLVINGGTLSYTGPAATTDRAFTIAGDTTLDVTNGLTFSSQIVNTATANVTKTSAGALTFSNSLNNLTMNALQVQQGTLNFNAGPTRRARCWCQQGILNVNGAVCSINGDAIVGQTDTPAG